MNLIKTAEDHCGRPVMMVCDQTGYSIRSAPASGAWIAMKGATVLRLVSTQAEAEAACLADHAKKTRSNP